MAADAFTLNWKNQFIYVFPSFSIIPRILQKIEEDQARALMIVPMWATLPWFPKLTRIAHPGTTSSPESSGCNPSFSERDGASAPEEITVDGLSLIRTGLAGGNISTRAQEIMLKSWREGTQKQYRVYLQKWISFCRGRHTDPVNQL